MNSRINKIIISTFLVTFIAFLFSSCEKYKVPRSKVPKCIRENIQDQKNNCLESVYKYDYKGETVYLFTTVDCGGADVISAALCDNECNSICFSGGISGGNMSVECPDFFQARTNEELIWEK